MKSRSEIKNAAKTFDSITPEERNQELTQLGFTEDEIAEVEKQLNPLVTKGKDSEEPEVPKPSKKKKELAKNPRYEEWKLVRSEGKVEQLKMLRTLSISPERAERLNAHKENSLLEYVLVED